MNKRISRNGINRIAKDYNTVLYKSKLLKGAVAMTVFDTMVDLLANMLIEDNVNFDKQRFLDAIYIERSK